VRIDAPERAKLSASMKKTTKKDKPHLQNSLGTCCFKTDYFLNLATIAAYSKRA